MNHFPLAFAGGSGIIVCMSVLSDNLGALAKVLGRLLAFPTKVLLVMATGVLGVLAILLGVLIGTGRTSTVGTVILAVVWVLLVLPVISLARRRRRWLRATDDVDRPTQVILPGPSDSTALTPADLTLRVEHDMRGQPGEEDVRVLFDAVTESRAPGSTHGGGARMTQVFSIGRLSPVGRALGRVDQAQRALLTAAGGPVQAPYLKDDLRISIAALVATLIIVPVGALFAIVVALILLTQ